MSVNGSVEILRWFEDDEATTEHGTSDDKVNYNSIVWSQAENGDPLVCVTGDSRIKVLNVRTGELTASVNDLAISPIDPTILASVSIDHSLRIWSLHPDHEKQPLGAICYGQGHKDQVLTIWAVPEDLKEHAGTDKPAIVHYPHFSTTEIHTDFIDW
ncbi:uncharacterized protein J4E87_005807 [Alternaria ethzedia]|uniref:uncharacterized protein n=1 Tax=Alternaria triticimaculans TaxID=297637 RepID=UPI0020C3B502|nr:uncharacterized protein J4E78_002152 [Alternaria triticimaculans]XP_049233038.1 uncharacterized protein J4E87_005807 [Alternaria ethzedia]KAI4624306.1 hypothetical protein J4E87_005807 [Alternaria ethzedia]KAI4668326.1 hypothetical protein J4E78_002152 [Alternaria triticimaculans]